MSHLLMICQEITSSCPSDDHVIDTGFSRIHQGLRRRHVRERSLHCPLFFLFMSLPCLPPLIHSTVTRLYKHVVLDLLKMIYYPIKFSSSPDSQREREKMNCDLLL